MANIDLYATFAAEIETAQFHKSALSNPSGNCVSVAKLSGGMRAVRDSKNPGAGVQLYTAGEWDAFVGGIADL